MAPDLARLVSASDYELFKKLIQQLSPAKSKDVNWRLRDRALANSIVHTFSSDSDVWPKLQNVCCLATHGGKPVVLSVLYLDKDLRNQLDELDANGETAAVWLATVSDDHFQFALSALHADRGLNKRSWKAFRTPFDKSAQFDFGSNAKRRFQELVSEAIDKSRTFDAVGRLEVHHFDRVIFPDHSHSRRNQNQVSVYAETRNITEEVFNEADELEIRTRKKIDQISVVLDRARRELDIVTLGGKDFIRTVAQAFFKSFCNEAPELEALVRRPIHMQCLARRPDFSLEGQTIVQAAMVDEIRLRSPTGWLCTFECKTRGRLDHDVYDLAEKEFGAQSPFLHGNWMVEAGRIRLEMTPVRVGRAPKIRGIELKPNGRTNLREHEDKDRFIANELLVRWGIFEEPDEDA